MPNNRCNGIVTNHFPGISMVEYHHDAQVCVRPGPRDLPLGTLIESEFQIQLDLCEHRILAVHAVHEFEPESDEQQPKVTTFKDDEPVSEDVIKRAAIPPKIRVDLSTIPEATKARIAAMPVESGPQGKKESWFDSGDPRG